MISNYSHDHIALDTMNIMANGQYIDQIMTNNQFYIFILTPKVSRQVMYISIYIYVDIHVIYTYIYIYMIDFLIFAR